MITTPTEERRPAANGAAMNQATEQGNQFDAERTAEGQHRGGSFGVDIVVVVDLARLERQTDASDAIRRHLWSRVESLPADTRVRLIVSTTPLPMTVDGLNLGHVQFTVEATTYPVAAAWAALLEQFGER